MPIGARIVSEDYKSILNSTLCLAYITKYKLRGRNSHVRMTDNEERQHHFLLQKLRLLS